jgi:hypothetical protein
MFHSADEIIINDRVFAGLDLNEDPCMRRDDKFFVHTFMNEQIDLPDLQVIRDDAA